jgi:hypothetical protein
VIRTASIKGAQDAAARYKLSSSILETLLGVVGAGVGGSLARGAIGAISPKAIPAIENAGAAPINAIRRMAGPPSPAAAIAKHLNNTPVPPVKGPRIV